ncbi:serine hydrolase domain-containing protein [uncultured Dokdonia sp.]|uniref:serine hydrolase domain-containing protein n=1 Tax=uncultured Dokdonia sp. TaxID=575653 RepID=UPI002621B328|nr:serine hydrolase domain-containing protein [uncultured Dokdonia sp.]
MNKILVFTLTLLIQLGTDSVMSQNIASKIDRLYEVHEDEPGFSIAVFKEDAIILEKQYGTAHLDYDTSITSETVFNVGSIGKQFTAAAILLLEQEGKLSIKDPVYKYIENLPRYKKGNPTIEHLLNQTSGIKEVDNYLEVVDIVYSDYISQPQLINIITKVKELRFTPGDYFYYTNANYVLLSFYYRKSFKKII